MYKGKYRELKEFEKRVNDAAIELCLDDVSLHEGRGDLLAMARRKVAEDGYTFRKGSSRLKMYGSAGSLAPLPK